MRKAIFSVLFLSLLGVACMHDPTMKYVKSPQANKSADCKKEGVKPEYPADCCSGNVSASSGTCCPMSNVLCP